MGVGGHIVMKTEITDDKGAAFQGVEYIKEIRKLFRKERALEFSFSFFRWEEDGKDRRCAVSIDVKRQAAETVRVKNVES